MLGLEDTAKTTGDWYHFRFPNNYAASDLTLLRADTARALAHPEKNKSYFLSQDRLENPDRDQLNALGVFTTIRDPHDRTLSWFKFCLVRWATPNTFAKLIMPHTDEQKTQICTKAHTLTNGIRTKEDLKLAFASFVVYLTANKEGRDLRLSGRTEESIGY
ncbi:hypothetical protein Naga_100235g3 [Nannochloropsis gaditana]|uniref:Sulfotransferase family protein n=1 Tax=Nannochloropsis gaditana TaxID=72520 RepID=W7THW3_9STRA|nr:hypothetical protein Naga_100235g3 [Nannochloropsis gaditana]